MHPHGPKVKVSPSPTLTGALVEVLPALPRFAGSSSVSMTRHETETLIADLQAVLDAPRFPEPEGKFAVVHVKSAASEPWIYEEDGNGLWLTPGIPTGFKWSDAVANAEWVKVLYEGIPR